MRARSAGSQRSVPPVKQRPASSCSRIAQAKRQVIDLDAQRERSIKDKVRFEDALKMRIAAYALFQADAKR